MKILIAVNQTIARNYAQIDWGWKLVRRDPLTFKDLHGDDVVFVGCNPATISALDPDTQIYYTTDSMDRYQLDDLSEVVSQYKVIRNRNTE